MANKIKADFSQPILSPKTDEPLEVPEMGDDGKPKEDESGEALTRHITIKEHVKDFLSKGVQYADSTDRQLTLSSIMTDLDREETEWTPKTLQIIESTIDEILSREEKSGKAAFVLIQIAEFLEEVREDNDT